MASEKKMNVIGNFRGSFKGALAYSTITVPQFNKIYEEVEFSRGKIEFCSFRPLDSFIRFAILEERIEKDV